MNSAVNSRSAAQIGLQRISAGNVLNYMKYGAPPYSFKSKAELHAYIKQTAKQYKLDAKLLKRIVAVESNNCKYRHNAKSDDHGCFQLNASTIRLYKWNKHAVVKNDMLNVHAAAIILKDFKRSFAAKEPNWFCRYNTGYRHLPLTCELYAQKLASVKF